MEVQPWSFINLHMNYKESQPLVLVFLTVKKKKIAVLHYSHNRIEDKMLELMKKILGGI